VVRNKERKGRGTSDEAAHMENRFRC